MSSEIDQQLQAIQDKLNAVSERVEKMKYTHSQVRSQSITATIRAEDALLEINNATFGIPAAKGRRTEAMLNGIRANFPNWKRSAPAVVTGFLVERDPQIKNKLIVKWDAVPENGYVYYLYRKDNDGEAVKVAEVTDGSNVIEQIDLSWDTHYSYYMVANDPFKPGLLSPPTEPIALFTPPEVPTDLSGLLSGQSPNLSWGVREGATYDIYRSETVGGVYTKIASDALSAAFMDASARLGKTYYYYVVAKKNGLESVPTSSFEMILPDPGAPAAPTGVQTLVSASPLQTKLTWNAQAGHSYQIYRSTSLDGSYALIGDSIIGGSYTDNSLSLGQTYYYYVIATENEYGVSSDASGKVSALMPPSAPTGVSSINQSNQVVITWNVIPGLTYVLYRSTEPSTLGTFVASNSATADGSYTDIQFVDMQTNYYTVVAKNASGGTGSSTSIYMNLPPEAPMLISVYGEGDLALNHRLCVTWTPTSGQINAYVKEGGGSFFKAKTMDASNGYGEVDDYLTKGRTYSVYLKQLKGSLESTASRTLTYTPN